MAEILIHRCDPDAGQPSSAYQFGDIVEIADDGEYENKPWITAIKIPGVNKDKIKLLMDSVLDQNDSEKIIQRRRFKIDKDGLTTLLNKSTQISLSLNDFEGLFLDKVYDKVEKVEGKDATWRQTLLAP